MLAQCGSTKCSASVILVENPISGDQECGNESGESGRFLWKRKLEGVKGYRFLTIHIKRQILNAIQLF